MKYIVCFFLLLTFYCSGVYAGSQQFLTKDQIILTESGIFYIFNDFTCTTNSLNYMGNGIYVVEYYGQCDRCFEGLEQNGKCRNKNCDKQAMRNK